MKRAIEEDKKKYGAEEQERRVRGKIREDLERAEELRKEEKRKGEEKIRKMEEREAKRRAEGKDPHAYSTEEEDDGVDNTVLTTCPPPDPRNSSFGAPLSTDYRLADLQKSFDESGATRAVVWRSGPPAVRSRGEEEEEEEEKKKRDQSLERENRSEIAREYEGAEKEALAVRDVLEKTGADPDSRKELVVLAAQLMDENEQLKGEKGETKSRKRSKSRSERSGSRTDGSSKRQESRDRSFKHYSSRQVKGIISSSGEDD